MKETEREKDTGKQSGWDEVGLPVYLMSVKMKNKEG